MKSPPDGYTLLLAGGSMAGARYANANVTYDLLRDFTPISQVVTSEFALVVNPSLPVYSVADLIKLAKERPGQLSYGTPGPGTMHHLQTEMLRTAFGLDLIHAQIARCRGDQR